MKAVKKRAKKERSKEDPVQEINIMVAHKIKEVGIRDSIINQAEAIINNSKEEEEEEVTLLQFLSIQQVYP